MKVRSSSLTKRKMKIGMVSEVSEVSEDQYEDR